GVPRPAERTDMRYQWIARLLANPRLDGDAVMQPFAEAAILHAGAPLPTCRAPTLSIHQFG
ncbi:MAG: hypothetical protein JF611_17430, partial [Betaproteobacteria bacterium]|nr:hypothetical protein [Betaproteobacteria bacterium]